MDRNKEDWCVPCIFKTCHWRLSNGTKPYTNSQTFYNIRIIGSRQLSLSLPGILWTVMAIIINNILFQLCFLSRISSSSFSTSLRCWSTSLCSIFSFSVWIQPLCLCLTSMGWSFFFGDFFFFSSNSLMDSSTSVLPACPWWKMPIILKICPLLWTGLIVNDI